jgi:predicted ATPase
MIFVLAAGGNPFCVLQFLQLLQDEKFLFYSLDTYKWEWVDHVRINRSTSIISDNVAELVAANMRKLSNEMQETLKIASCLGTQFPVVVMMTFFENAQEKQESKSEDTSILTPSRITEYLDQAVEIGILNPVNSQTYAWSHDHILQAAYSLVPEADRRDLHVRLGYLLANMHKSNPTAEWMLYVAAAQFNIANVSIGDETMLCIHLAQLNVDASKLCISKSAFQPAAEFLRAAPNSLDPSTMWEENYDLCLELYTLLAEMESLLGNVDASKEVIRQVIDHAKTVDDKYKVCSLEASLMTSGTKRDYVGAQELYMKVLRQHGIPIKKNSRRFWLEYQLRRDFPKQNWRNVGDLPTMTDKQALRKVDLLTRLIFVSFPAGYYHIAEIAGLHALRLTFEFGITPNVITAILMPAFRLRKERKFKQAREHCDLAIQASERFKGTPEYARIMILIHQGIAHMSRSFHESLDPLIECHGIMISLGEMEAALISAMGYSLCYFAIGLKIEAFESDLVAYHQLAQQFHLPPSIQCLFLIFRQTVLNLQGKAANPTILKGEAMDEDTVLKSMLGSSQHKSTLRDIFTFRSLLACVYNDVGAMDTALDVMLEFALVSDPLIVRQHVRMTYVGIACLQVGRERRNRKYLKVGRKIMKEFFFLARQGSVNAHPVLLLLQAVEENTEEKYNQASTACARAGLIHLEAMAHERAGILTLNNVIDEGAKEFHFVRAMELYGDWGASGKVAQLKEKYGFLASNTTQLKLSTSQKARSRFRHSVSNRLEKFDLAESIIEKKSD